MAQSRSSRFQRTGGRSRRKSSWVLGVGGTTVSASLASEKRILGVAITPTESGLTIVRMRGLLCCYLTLATAVGDGFQGAFGIGLATTKAVVAGASSLPGPVTEVSFENWLFWAPISIHGPVVSSTSLNDATVQEIPIDTKAMRKFDDDMTIFGMVEVVEIGTATCQYFMDTRALVLLS